MNTLTYDIKKQGPIMVSLMTAENQREEIISRRHGTFHIIADDAGRQILSEQRSVSGKVLGTTEWNTILTIERVSGNPMLYQIRDAATNEVQVRAAPNARQIIMDILDQEERQWSEMLLGI